MSFFFFLFAGEAVEASAEDELADIVVYVGG